MTAISSPASMGTITPELSLSELAPRVLQSEIRAMSMECDRLGGVNLAQGICDTEVPAPVSEGAIQAIQDGHNIYTRLDGIARLRKAIAGKLRSFNGIEADPDREILVTSGATAGLHAAAMALLNPGDEVILFEPFYGYHVSTLRSMRVVPIAVPLAAPTEKGGDWTLDLDAVRAALTPRTRAMIVNTPSNPCGKIFTRAELEALSAIAEEFQLFVFTDEIYEHFVYGEAKHLSPATLPGMRERTVLISGFSKTFSVTGWRLGYLMADAKWLGAIAYFHDLTYVCAPSALQHGAAAGLEQLSPGFYTQLATDHLDKRARIVSALEDAGMTPYVPAGSLLRACRCESIAGRECREESTRAAGADGSCFGGGVGLFQAGVG